MCYLGAGYQGMQRNPGAKTIESDLEKALHLVGGIQDDVRFNFGRLQWARAARTDKGVSAVAQVVSLNMLVPRNDPQDMAQEINKHLPKQIKILGLIRTTPSFDAKGLCDYRVYEYLLPVWVLNPNTCKSAECILDILSKSRDKKLDLEKLDDILQEVLGQREIQQNLSTQVNFHDFEYDNDEQQIEIPEQFFVSQQYQQQQDDFNLTEIVRRLNLILGEYKGTHSFYNFTSREKVDNPNLVRFIRKFRVAGLICFKRDNNSSNVTNNSSVCIINDNQETKNQKIIGDSTGTDQNAEIQENIQDITKRNIDTYSTINIDDNSAGITNNDAISEYVNDHKNNQSINISNEQNENKSYNSNNISDCWIRLQVTGQSFLLYQIRKMISLAIAMMRNEAPEDAIETALKPTRDLNIPPSPAAPLYLNECNFSSYNQKWDDRQKIDPMNDFADQISEFKQQILHPYIYQFCKNTKVFEVYCYNLRDSAYNFSKWKDMEETIQNSKQKKRKLNQSCTQSSNKVTKIDVAEQDGN